MPTTDTLSPAPPRRALRVDAQRNYERLLEAANAAFAEHGAEASLDEIARRAGVGIGTLYRHFPTRQDLAEAVYRTQVQALCDLAGELLASPAPGEALAAWLRAVIVFGSTKRGLATFLKTVMSDGGSSLAWCKTAMHDAGGALLARAQQAGAVRPDIEIYDLLRLAHGVSWATEMSPDGVDRTDRYLDMMMGGLRSQEPSAH